MTGPVLFTERLILRPLAQADLEPWIAFHADAETMRYLGGVQPAEVAWRGLCAMIGAWAVAGWSMFAVTERVGGAWVGRIGPWTPLGWPGNEVGWGVASAYAGKGYAHEAATAAIDYAVDVLGWNEVIHTIDPDNARSIHLAERLGATNGGPTSLPPPLAGVRVDRWSQTAAHWRARRQEGG